MRALLLLCCAWLATGGAGCRRDCGTSEALDFWAMGREGEVVRGMLGDFERRHQIEVRVQQIPWSAAHEKLLTAFVGETMPDVFQAGTTWLPELVALGAAEPLQSFIDRSSAIARDEYFAGIMDASSIGSMVYGIPWYVDTRLLFYRTDLLAEAGYTEPPRTWSEWTAAMGLIQARQAPGRHAIVLPMGEWELPVILASQLGANLLRDDDQFGDFRSPVFAKAFEFYLDLFRRGLASHSGATQIANLYQDFAGGYFCFHVTGPWNIGEFRRRLPASMQGRWATAPMPAPDSEYPGVSIAGGAALVISHRSPRKEAAWRLIEFLSASAQQVVLHRRTGDLPARRSVWQDPALRDDPAARAFAIQLQRLRSTPRIPEWEQIAQRIASYAEAAIRGEMDSARALAALDGDVDRLLEKRRWLMRRSARTQVNADDE